MSDSEPPADLPPLPPSPSPPAATATAAAANESVVRDIIAVAEEALSSSTAGRPLSEHHEDEALEWHEVIELQAFSERKSWIEEKIKFLEQMPPIEVFVGMDAVRSSAIEVPGLPTRDELKQWLVEHDRIEKETEIFDSGELKKLKKFTKAAAQRNLSPADTDLIEMTLTTIYQLDKLLHLLRDRSDNLELLGIRLTWEEKRIAAWTELRKLIADLGDFMTNRARWSPTVYDDLVVEDPSPTPPYPVPNEPLPKRRNSVISVASESSGASLAGYSRGARFKLSEALSREAAQFASRTSSLRHTKIVGAGKILDKLIDTSRKQIPDEMLDEQDKLENQGITEMEDMGKFIMHAVMQWKKADEFYVETMKVQSDAQTLLEEIEVAKLNHPNPRQDIGFYSRVSALNTRLSNRGNPAHGPGALPRPTHLLFPDQDAVTDSITQFLTTELASAHDQVKKAERCAKEYRASLEAVKKVEVVSKTASELSATFLSLIERLKNGIATSSGDGTPPDLSTQACLDNSRHSVFLSLLPPLLQELQRANDEATPLLSSARAALLHLDFPGIDPEFKKNTAAILDALEANREAAARAKELVSARAAALSDVRTVWTAIDQIYQEVEDVRSDIVDAMSRQMWKQQFHSHEAPPTPESPNTTLPPSSISPSDVTERLANLRTRLAKDVSAPLAAVSPSLGHVLRDYLIRSSAGLEAFLKTTADTADFWESVQKQATAMGTIRDEVYSLQVQIEDLKVRFDQGAQDVFAGNLAAEASEALEGTLDGELSGTRTAIQEFLNRLSLAVPFVGQMKTQLPVLSGTPKRRASLAGGGLSLDVLQQATQLALPFDPAALDKGVRNDTNTYSIMLAGAIQALESKADYFRLARKAFAVDSALADVTRRLHDAGEAIASIQTSAAAVEGRLPLDRIAELAALVDQLPTTHGMEIARSLSPVRELYTRLQVASGGSDASARDAVVSSRHREVENIEAQFTAWQKSVATLRQQLSDAKKAEELRLAEDVRLKEEQERLAAETEALRLREHAAAAEKERLEALERSRLEREAIEAKERLERERLEALARAEREREDAEERERLRLVAEALEEERRRREFESVLGPPFSHSPLETVSENSFSMSASEDVFGLRSGTDSDLSPEMSELSSRIRAFRKRLRSLGINDAARPNTRSSATIPDDATRTRMAKSLSDLVVEVDALPHVVPDESSIDAELRSLRSELEASSELMSRVHRLADFATALRECDEALSDLLEHIDSYPAPPFGPLASSHISDANRPPEEQLTARLAFTKETVKRMMSLAKAVRDDPRVPAEVERATQTWSELEAMALDRVSGQKSRPASVVSSSGASGTSGRSTRASMVKAPSHVDKHKRVSKKDSFSKLSAGSPGGKFLTPPAPGPQTRRTASGGPSTSHVRSSSRLSIASTSRAVSNPSSNITGSTFASRQRTTSTTSSGPLSGMATPVKRIVSGSRGGRSSMDLPRAISPAMSEMSYRSRSSLNIPRTSTSNSTSQNPSWSRAPRTSFPTLPKSPPSSRSKPKPPTRKPYVANPKNKLDVAVGDVVNKLPVDIKIELVEDTWKDQSGKYWIGDTDPKLCFCRILRSQTVMVRVGGGWTELSRFIKDHFADAFRWLPESPRLGSTEEKWISSTSLGQALEELAPLPPRTPEPTTPFMPAFVLSTPSGKSPQSLKTSPSPGSPLAALQFIRRADLEASTMRPETPTRLSRSTAKGPPPVLGTPVRLQPTWRP